MNWTKQEPTSLVFTAVDGPDTWTFDLTTVGSLKRGTLKKNGAAQGYIDFPTTTFAKDFFTQLAPLL